MQLLFSFTILATLNVGARATVAIDIQYGRASDVSLKPNVSVPDGPGPFAAMILLDGGGSTGGRKATNFATLHPVGIDWLSVNHRLAPMHRWPACLDDVETAIGWVKAHSCELIPMPNVPHGMGNWTKIDATYQGSMVAGRVKTLP